MVHRLLLLIAAWPTLAAINPATAGEEGSDQQSTATHRLDSVVPLFSSDSILAFRVEAPLEEVFKERGQESNYHPAKLSYGTESGGRIQLDIGVRTRGKTRLNRRVCAFPPIKLNFKKNEVANTVFAGQDKLKLVTHCRSRNDYEQYVMLEYLIYRAYNIFTNLSLRVRPALITYVDTESPGDSLTRFAFLIEDADAMAARTGWEMLKVPAVQPDLTEPYQLSQLELFQFMIGNTDWAAFQAEPDRDECCHNTKPMGTTSGPVFAVPYDFDWAGLVAPPYAVPPERLPIKSVKERYFWGLCRPESELRAALDAFDRNKASVYSLFQDFPLLNDKYRREAIEYLDEFYELIASEHRVNREIVRNCRRVSVGD